MVLDDLDHARAAKPLQRLGALVQDAGLRPVEGVAHGILHRVGERPEILLARSNPGEGLYGLAVHQAGMVLSP
jgi:hypothetical protein